MRGRLSDRPDGRIRPGGRMTRVPPTSPAPPEPDRARRSRAAGHRRRRPDHALQRARQPADADPAGRAAPRRRGRARRPRGPAAGAGAAGRSRRLAGRGPDPRAVRPVPPPLPHARRRSASGTPAAPSSPSSTRSPTPSWRTCAAAGRVVLLALAGTGTPELSPVALVRATLVAAASIEAADVVVVPLAAHGDADEDHALGAQVVATYAAGDPVHGLVDGGDLPDEIAAIVERDQPAPEDQGLVLFFTGLSGSGKSTLARALMDRLLEQGERSVTSLDGDVVRRHLSAGLTFSKEDRETNIRRIGWVAAEIARHGGVAVCSPDRAVRRDPAAGARDGRGRRRRVLPRARRHAAGGVRATRPQGPLREGPARRDPRVHRHLLALRGAGRRRRPRRHHRPHDRGRPRRRPRRAPRERLPRPRSVASRSTRSMEVERREPPSTPTPLKVLFVCTANICRSPYMELATRRLLGDDASVEVSSAGTHGFDATPMSNELIGGYETEAESFRSRRATARAGRGGRRGAHRRVGAPDLPARGDAGARSARSSRSASSPRRCSRTPATRPLPAVARCSRELSQHRSRGRPARSTSTDPYRRGPEVGRACAARIDDLLGIVVPALRQSSGESVDSPRLRHPAPEEHPWLTSAHHDLLRDPGGRLLRRHGRRA